MAAPPQTHRRVSEPARERETFRYNAALLANFAFNFIDNGRPPMPSEVRPSSDRILSALAQLAVCQTGTSRSFISLFDQTYQYIVAEATTTLLLGPDLQKQNGLDENVGMCGIAIPRELGICEHVLCASDPIEFEKDNVAEGIPTIIVRNITDDPRFCGKPYNPPESPYKFYAAVPIRTYRGVNIGVLAVMNEDTSTDWNDRQSQIMRNLSCTIMDHLEATRNSDARRRSERMNRGLGSFLEGRLTVSSWRDQPGEAAFRDRPREGAPINTFHSPHGLLNSHGGEQTSLPVQDMSLDPDSHTPPPKRRKLESSQDDTAYISVHDAGTPRSASGGDSTPFEDGTSMQNSHGTFKKVFSTAAGLIRESIEIEGCLFLAASLGSAASSVTKYQNDGEATASSASSNGSEDDQSWLSDESLLQPCQVLGSSSMNRPGTHEAPTFDSHGTLTKRCLAKLLREYPKGHVFNFDANGDLHTNDSTEYDYHGTGRNATAARGQTPDAETMKRKNGDEVSSSKPQTHNHRSWSRQKLASAVVKTFPGARSVAFVPIWDARKERWCSGGFVYTSTPSRVFTVEDDLSFLRAFGMLAMSEVHRLETSLSEKIKSDALSSLSHELRSPLHGVVLGVELLNDTSLDVFQGNIVHMVETCCRTLADTIDHLLDFSKVNQFLKEEKRTARNALGSSSARGSADRQGRNLFKDIKIDAIAEEVVDSVFAGFIFQRLSIQQLRRQKSKNTADTDAMRRLDSMQAVDEFGPKVGKDGTYQLRFRDVLISLAIEPAFTWTCHTSPGAVRRIIMNLFGNALKYTEKGYIKVELRQSKYTGKSGIKGTRINIRVSDTGKGISEDYLQHKLFKPFSQEDHLSPGTGLGLSLVKQITTQLRGSISVNSKVGVGTAIHVSLPMTPALMAPRGAEPQLSEEDAEFQAQVGDLKGLRVKLVGFSKCKTMQTNDFTMGPFCSAQDVCRDWLHMTVVDDADPDLRAPDLILCTEEALPANWDAEGGSAKPPAVVICANTLVAHHLVSQFESEPRSNGYEFTSQPVGPRKLAKAFSMAMKRWAGRQTMPRVITEAAVGASPLSRTLNPGSQSLNLSAPKNTSLVRSRCEPTRLPSPSTPTSPDAKPKFLLVDDNFVNMRILCTYMKKLGQTYETAGNGQEALDKYQQDPYHFQCILMDISMPIMDGFEAAQLIRAFEREHQVQPATIIALTGLASEAAQEEAAGSGIDLLLSKPVKLKELSTELTLKGIINQQ